MIYAEDNEPYIRIAEGFNVLQDATFNQDVTVIGTLTAGNIITPLSSSTSNLTTYIDEVDTHIPSTFAGGPSQNYRGPTGNEVTDILNGLRLIAQEAGKAYLDIDTTEAETLLTPYGFTVTKGYDSVSRRPFVRAASEYTYPASSNYRSWGIYFFDMSQPISMVIEAPHPQTDGNTEHIGLQLWQKTPGALFMLANVNRKAKDYMTAEVYTTATSGAGSFTFRGQTTTGTNFNASPSSVQTAIGNLSTVGAGKVICTGSNLNSAGHLFINLDPSLYDPLSPTDTIVANTGTLNASISVDNDADQAHNYSSIFNKAAEAFAKLGYVQLQVHGYADVSGGVPRGFSAILSPGNSNSTKLLDVVRNALEANGFDVALKSTFDTQCIYITGSPTGGTTTYDYNSQTTSSVAYSTDPFVYASNLQTGFEGLSSVGPGNVAVTISSNSNGSIPTFIVTFRNRLYHAGATAITVNTNSLTGGTSPAANIVTADDTALTATSNTQGDGAESNGTPFLHLELSATVRTTMSDQLVAALANLNLPQLGAAATPVLAQTGHSPSQSPGTNGSVSSIGSGVAAARDNHSHAATSNTPTSGDIIYRGSSWLAGTPDVAGVVAKAGSQTITGSKTFTADIIVSDATVISGTTTNTFSQAYKVTRTNTTVGAIDNNAGGIRMKATTASAKAYIHNNANAGLEVDNSSSSNAVSVDDNLILRTAGKGLQIKEGSNAKMGTATLVTGAATVSTTAVTANSRILLTIQSLGTVAAPKAIGVTARSAGTSFTITSADATDTSIIAWMIVEPAA